MAVEGEDEEGRVWVEPLQKSAAAAGIGEEVEREEEVEEEEEEVWRGRAVSNLRLFLHLLPLRPLLQRRFTL